MKYVKKPVVIDAWLIENLLWLVNRNQFDRLPAPVLKEFNEGGIIFNKNSLVVNTLEGDMLGEPTDMLIQGIQGEFYPCKPDIFNDSYEAVND